MDILGILKGFWESSGLAVLTWREGVMILVSFVLLYLAIAKKFEPLLLLPIAFGILLANLPGAGLMDDPTGIIDPLSTTIREGAHWYDIGILRLIYAGVKSSIFPCLIFMGVGAMTDFGPLLANPMSLLLGAAAQLGIYVAFTIAILLGFTPQEAAAIGIIGGADGETDIVVSDEANTANLDAAVAAIEAVNPIANPRALDDFSVENELMLTMDNLVGYKGDVTNDQADCGLVFVAQAKDGKVDAVKAELEAYKESLSANDLYAEFADKVALAKDARIVTNGNYVAIVIAGIANPDYAPIDTALETALNF